MSRGIEFIIAFLVLTFLGCGPSPNHWNNAKKEYASQDFLGCILELNLLLEQQPATDSVLVLRAHCYNRVEQHDKAEADLLHALDLNPQSLGAKLGYAQLLAYRGDTTKALAMLSLPAGNAKGRTKSDFILEKAKLLFYTQQFSESLHCLNQSITVDSTNPEAWFLRAAFYGSSLTDSSEGYFQPLKSLSDYQMAISRNPRFSEAYFKLALVELDIFADELAGMKHLSLAIQFDPYNSDYYVERGQRYSSQGKMSQAIRDFQTALNLNPLDSLARDGINRLEIK